MASFYDTTVGQQQQFQIALALAGFTDKDIARVIREPELALAMLEAIQPTTAVPSWYVSPEQQLAYARRLWPGAVLPEPPQSFTPNSKNEVLLLHVPDTFDSLWDKVIAPMGYTKYCRRDSVRTQEWNMRLAPNKRQYTEPVWLGFDPEHGKGVRPDSLWGSADLAGPEVFSALIQFPNWISAWLIVGPSAPNLAGYQLKHNREWLSVPCVSRWDDGRRLSLSGSWAGCALRGYASPSVREC